MFWILYHQPHARMVRANPRSVDFYLRGPIIIFMKEMKVDFKLTKLEPNMLLIECFGDSGQQRTKYP